MKVCDNADSDYTAAATNSTPLKLFVVRVQSSFCLEGVKLLENGVFQNYETIAVDRIRRFPNLSWP
jgi:hypothetical protein